MLFLIHNKNWNIDYNYKIPHHLQFPATDTPQSQEKRGVFAGLEPERGEQLRTTTADRCFPNQKLHLGKKGEKTTLKDSGGGGGARGGGGEEFTPRNISCFLR